MHFHHHHCAFEKLGITLSGNAQHYKNSFTIYLVLANQLCQSYFEREPPPPISTPQGAYSSAASHGALHFKPFAIMTSLPHRRVRNPVVGCESDDPWAVFNVHQSQTWQHTPQPFYWVGYHSYICHSTGGDGVLPNPYLLASVSTEKVWWALLFGTLAIAAGYINWAAIPSKEGQ